MRTHKGHLDEPKGGNNVMQIVAKLQSVILCFHLRSAARLHQPADLVLIVGGPSWATEGTRDRSGQCAPHRSDMSRLRRFGQSAVILLSQSVNLASGPYCSINRTTL
jgi:hypothetical protein